MDPGKIPFCITSEKIRVSIFMMCREEIRNLAWWPSDFRQKKECEFGLCDNPSHNFFCLFDFSKFGLHIWTVQYSWDFRLRTLICFRHLNIWIYGRYIYICMYIGIYIRWKALIKLARPKIFGLFSTGRVLVAQRDGLWIEPGSNPIPTHRNRGGPRAKF